MNPSYYLIFSPLIINAFHPWNGLWSMIGVLLGVLLIHFSVDSISTGVSSLGSIRDAVRTARALCRRNAPKRLPLPEGSAADLKHILRNPLALKRVARVPDDSTLSDPRDRVVEIWESDDAAFRRSLPVAFPNTFGISYIFIGKEMPPSLKKFVLLHEYSHVAHGGVASISYKKVISVIALIHYVYLASVYANPRLLWFGAIIVVSAGIWGAIKPEVVADVEALKSLTAEEREKVALAFRMIGQYSRGTAKIFAYFRAWMARRPVRTFGGWIFRAEVIAAMFLLVIFLSFIRPSTPVEFNGAAVFWMGLAALLLTWIPRDRLARSQVRWAQVMAQIAQRWK